MEGDLIEEYITNSTWRGEVCHKVQVHARLSWNVSLHTTNVHHFSQEGIGRFCNIFNLVVFCLDRY